MNDEDRAIPEPKEQLRQRIVGGLVLLALAVILVPLLLSGLPSDPEIPEMAPIPPVPQYEVEEFEQAEPIADTTVPAGRASYSETPAVADPEGEPGQFTDSGLFKAWAVRVGQFAVRANALALERKLRDSGYKVDRREVVEEGIRYHLVYVGPTADPQLAKRLLAEMREQFEPGSYLVEWTP